jgi:hypothetical protein
MKKIVRKRVNTKKRVNLKGISLNSKRSKVNKKEFEKFLERIEDPNYQGGSWALSANPTLLEKTKYELCQKVLTYHLDKDLNTDETAKKMKLSKAETEDILHCRLDYFTLDRLTTHAGYLFAPSQTKITVELKPNHRRNKKSAFIHA